MHEGGSERKEDGASSEQQAARAARPKRVWRRLSVAGEAGSVISVVDEPGGRNWFCNNDSRVKRKSICAAILVLTLAATARADVIRILDDDRDAAQARVDIIQQARFEISAVYFLARNDGVTMTALALLREAHSRGVTTRLIVDAAFNHIPKPVLAHLAEEGVEIRVYHPLTLRHPTWLFRRMHEKFVVADGRRYITGGRNLATSYFGLARRNFVDRDVYVDGGSAIDADQHFERLWASAEVRTLHVRVPTVEKVKAAKMLDDVLAMLRVGNGFVDLDTGRDWSAGRHDVAAVDFLHDPIDGDLPRVGERLDDFIAGAKSSVLIESPYVVPTRGLLELLEKKCHDGINIQIVTNSLRSTDGMITYVAFLKYRRRLLRQGVDIREFRGRNTLHSKSIVIDDSIALIGSYNLDARSRNLNAEVMCAVRDPVVARELRDSIDRDAEHSSRVVTRVNRVQRWRMKIMRMLLPLVERQL